MQQGSLRSACPLTRRKGQQRPKQDMLTLPIVTIIWTESFFYERIEKTSDLLFSKCIDMLLDAQVRTHILLMRRDNSFVDAA